MEVPETKRLVDTLTDEKEEVRAGILHGLVTSLNNPNNNKMDVYKEIADTKQLRKDVDDIIQRVKGLDQSRETSLVITKLQEGVMWLGMNLKRLGETDPYPKSRNPESDRIEPTADGLKM